MADVFRQSIDKSQPCKKDCPNRAPGCAISCPAWAQYLEKRNQRYQDNAEIAQRYCKTQEGSKRAARYKKRKT